MSRKGSYLKQAKLFSSKSFLNFCNPSSRFLINWFLIKTRTYETSESGDRVHLGHLKKKIEKKLKKNSKVENQNISYGRAS